MAEQLVKLFGKEIQKNLFPDNAFYKQSRLDGGVNVNAKTIQVPQAGGVPTVSVDPSSFPLTISQRTDDVKEYSVSLFATEPIHIEDVNLMVINYDKRSDILQDHSLVLNETIADNMAYAWGADSATSKVLTTGGTRASSFGGAAKKAVAYSDLVNLMTKFDADNIPEEGRNLLCSAQMYQDLLKINEFISFDYNNNKPVVNGSVGTILGFNVFKRSSSVSYDLNGDKKAYSDAEATTDKDSIIAWHRSFVRRAEGNIKVYADTNKPEYLGSIYNAAVRNGGMIGRTDEKGVYAIVQDEF